MPNTKIKILHQCFLIILLITFIVSNANDFRNTNYFIHQLDSIKRHQINSINLPSSDVKIINKYSTLFQKIDYPLKRCDYLNHLAEELSEVSWQPYNRLLYEYTLYLKGTRNYSGADLKIINEFYASSLNNLAIIDRNENRLDSALEKYYTSAKIFLYNKDYKSQINVLENAYKIEIESNSFRRALNCLEWIKDIQYKYECDYKKDLLKLYFADFYLQIGMDSIASDFMDKFTKVFKGSEYESNDDMYYSYQMTRSKMKKFNAVESDLKNKISSLTGYYKYMLTLVLTRNYLDQKKYKNAVYLIESTITELEKEKVDPLVLLNQFYFILSGLYQNLNEFKLANNYLKKVNYSSLYFFAPKFKKNTSKYIGLDNKLNYYLTCFLSKNNPKCSSIDQNKITLRKEIELNQKIKNLSTKNKRSISRLNVKLQETQTKTINTLHYSTIICSSTLTILFFLFLSIKRL